MHLNEKLKEELKHSQDEAAQFKTESEENIKVLEEDIKGLEATISGLESEKNDLVETKKAVNILFFQNAD